MAVTNSGTNTIQGFYSLEDAANTIPKATQAIYNRSLLERALPLLVHAKFGQRSSLSRANGKSMIFRRYVRLTEATTPLSEGVTPAGDTLTKTEVVATIKQYGNYVTVSDVMDWVNFDPIMNESSELMGENMGETMDIIYRDIINAGTVAYTSLTDGATGTWQAYSSRASTAAGIHKKMLDRAINALDRANAKKFTTLVEGSNKVASYPLAPAYWAIIHPDLTRDLYDSTNSGLTKGTDFVPVEQYSSQSQVMPGEVGKYRSIRFIETTFAKRWVDSGATPASPVVYRTTSGSAGAGSSDVYSVLILARDAYGIVPLEAGNARTIIHRAGGNQDPLNQRNTIGWKSASTAVVLEDNNMVRLEVLSRL